MNIVLIILDTLRQDHVGAYGNDWIHTPNLDQLASESVLFTRCYPESLPTLPVRRALHTGKRTFPFADHRDYKGDFKGAPGWGPIPEEQDTVAEILSEEGYRTLLVTDCYHQFKPSKNFHRGFQEWHWIRGQEGDAYRAGPPVPRERRELHTPRGLKDSAKLERFLTRYLRNNSYRMVEEDYYPARVFTQAASCVWSNQDAASFFMVVDSFDPHEPWDPPVYYRKMYDPDEDVVDVIQSPYGSWLGTLTPREVRRLQANYAGEVTMVDRWLGYYLESLRASGWLENTVVAVISDHGHNLGFDPGDKGLVSKQGQPMTHAVADLVMMIRHPDGEGAGTVCNALCYNHDLTTTLMTMIGVSARQEMDGIDLWPVVRSQAQGRNHVTVAWGPLVTVITDEWWYNADVWAQSQLLFRVDSDQQLEEDLAREYPDVCSELHALAIDDAGGEFSADFSQYLNRGGCTPLEAVVVT